MVINLALSFIFGFFGSFVVQKAMSLFLGLRAHWLHTLAATLLTAGVCGACFILTSENFDPKSSTYFLRVFACTLLAATATGTLVIRFNIHGDQGDQPSWAAALGMTALIVVPLLGLMSLIHLVST